MRIRPATAADADAIAEVHVASWRGAYAGLMPQEFLDALDATRRAEGWRGVLACTDWPRCGAFIAEDDAGAAGFAHISPSRDAGSPDSMGELTSIYVRPTSWGSGDGLSLMSACVRSLSSGGFDAATLWVLDGNARARRFYDLAGWSPDGDERIEQISEFAVREIRYWRPLG